MRKEAPQKSEHGLFTSGAARQALAALRRNRSGALLVTSGHRDVRLVVEARRVSIEAVGLELEDAGEDAWEISRQFLAALFWGSSTYFLDLEGKPMTNALAIRAEAVPDKAIDLIDEGFRELTDLRQLIPGVDVLVSRKGPPPPKDAKSCAASLYRSLTGNPRHLGSAAKDAGLDPLDAAWAVSDLLEAEAAQIKRPAPTMAVRRLKSAEPLVREGLSPGVRALHLARGYARSEPRRSAHFLKEAGLAFLASGQGVEALEMFKKSHEQAPKDLGGLEGMVRALEVVGQTDEARQIREDLVDLYRSWNLPSRTLEHLEALAPLTIEQELSKLECLLTRRDFKGAIDQARRVFPKVTSGQRVTLARQFGQAGAPKALQSEAIALSGAQRLLWPRRVLVLTCLVLFTGVGALSAETYARIEFKRAASQTRLALNDLEPRKAGAAPVVSGATLLEPWARLQAIQTKVGPAAAHLPRQSVLGSLPALLTELEAIQTDAAFLQDAKARRALDWKTYDSVRLAKEALLGLKAAAKSEALKRRADLDLAAIKAYIEEVDARVRTFSNKSQAETKLSAGQELLRDFANAASRFADKTINIDIDTSPAKRTQAIWQLKGGKPKTLESEGGPGKFQARLPLRRGARGTLRLSSPDYVPRVLKFQIETLEDPTLAIELIRCVPIGARVDRLKVRETSGLIVRDEALDRKAFSRSPPRIASSAKALASIKKSLRSGERLIVQLVLRTRSTGRPRGSMPYIYLSGIRVWLDVPKTGRKGRGYLVDLNQHISPGLHRRVERRAGKWVVPAISDLERFNELLPAIRHALLLERKVLK
ncbi:MAG: hypothetical protein JKY65_06330 [Planctomycetes bacterium]|nr:hypothetical protein [Planctomycetota bacterium]